MNPSLEELQLGAKAYQRIQIYDKYTRPNLRQLPWILAGCVLFLFCQHVLLHQDIGWIAGIIFVMAPLAWLQSVSGKESYRYQKMVLQLLEEKYGRELPWIVEEQQLAEAQKLESEMASVE